MSFLARFSPVRAYRDLRLFLAQREPYELGFLLLAMAVTGFFIFAFLRDSHVEATYKPNIIYVQQWTADRTEAQILAQQKVDQAQRTRDLADQRRREEENRAAFKRLDDKLKRYGL